MSHRYLLVTPVVLLILAGVVMAQAPAAPPPPMPAPAAPAASIPIALKLQTSLTAAEIASIKSVVAGQVATLQQGTPPAQTAARESLIAETQAGGQSATPFFLNIYATALNESLAPLADATSFRVRLNTAIIAARVAERSDNVALGPLVSKLINDKEASVTLWAIKAAKYVIPAMLRNGNPSMALMIVPAIKKNASTRSPLSAHVSEGYEALTLDLGSKRENVTPQMIGAVVPELLKLLALRAQEYAQGLPDDPAADNKAMTFLTDMSSVWPTLTPAQQMEVVQRIFDLISLGGERTVFVLKDKDRVVLREGLLTMLRRAAGGLALVGNAVKSNGLALAAGDMQKLGGDTGEEIQSKISALELAIKAVPPFKDLKPAPKAQAVTTRPAT